MRGENDGTVSARRELLRRILSEDCVNLNDGDRLPVTVWSYYNSFFFCFTVVTTIGEVVNMTTKSCQCPVTPTAICSMLQ